MTRPVKPRRKAGFLVAHIALQLAEILIPTSGEEVPVDRVVGRYQQNVQAGTVGHVECLETKHMGAIFELEVSCRSAAPMSGVGIDKCACEKLVGSGCRFLRSAEGRDFGGLGPSPWAPESLLRRATVTNIATRIRPRPRWRCPLHRIRGSRASACGPRARLPNGP